MRGKTFFLAWLAAAACGSVLQGAPAAPEGLRCEGLVNPLGIDRDLPRFSWAIPPGARGLAQAARQVLVAGSPDALAEGRGTLWDSGKVESSQSQWVTFGGAPLPKGARCWWKVRVWDATGEPSPWSEPASFTVGPLSASDWSGKWIGADWMANCEGPLPWLRKTFTLEKAPAAATIHVCALGYYELHVNGRKVGDDVLSPAVSPNTTAAVAIPATGLGEVREGGRPVETRPGISGPAVENGVFRCEVASGDYRFASRLPPR